jgi:tRNA A-37 threonylcarbamoyl transferase component Bud32
VDDQDGLKQKYEQFRQFMSDVQLNMQQSGRTKLFRLIKQGKPIAEIQTEIARLQSTWEPSKVRKQLLNLDEYITTSNLPAATKLKYKNTLEEANEFIDDAKQPKKRVQKGSHKSKKSKESGEFKTESEDISDATKTNLYRVLIKDIDDKKINVTPQIKAAVHKLMLSNGRDDAVTLANAIKAELTDAKWSARLAAMQFYVDTYDFSKLLRSQIQVDDGVLRQSIRDLMDKKYDKDKIWKLIQVTTNQLRDKKPTTNIKLAEKLIKDSDNERVEKIAENLKKLKTNTKSIGEKIRDLSIRDLEKYRTRLDNVKKRTPLENKEILSRIEGLLGDIDMIQSQMVQLRKGLLVEDRKPRKPSKKEVAAAAVDGANAQVNARRPKKKGSPRNIYEKVRQLFDTQADGKARESNRLHDSARLRLADNAAKRNRYALVEEKKRADQEDWENYEYYLEDEHGPYEDLFAANDTSWIGNEDDAAANDTTGNEDDAAANDTFWNVNDDDADAANVRLRQLEQDVLRQEAAQRAAAPKARPKTKQPTQTQIDALLNLLLAKKYTNPKRMASGTDGIVYSMQLGPKKYVVKMQRVPDESQFDREVKMQKEFAGYGLAPIVEESNVINMRGEQKVGLIVMPEVETLDAYLSKRRTNRKNEDLANVVQGLITLVRDIAKHKLTHGDLTLFNTYLEKGKVGAIDFGRASTVFAPNVDSLRVAMELYADTRTDLGQPIEAFNSQYLSTDGLTKFKKAFNIQSEPQETVRAWAAAYEQYCVAAEVACLPSAKPTKSSAKSRK